MSNSANSLTKDNIRSALKSGERTFVYQFGRGVGFCADYSWLLTCLIKCLQFGYDFRLGTIHQPSGFVTGAGWDDYFEPFFQTVDAPFLDILNVTQFPLAKRLPWIKSLARPFLKAATRPRADLFMFDNLGVLQRLGAPVFIDDQSFVSACEDLLGVLWVFNDKTQREIDAHIADLGMMPKIYGALHIRRGDKSTEHPYVPVSQYVNAIRALPGDIRHVFVGTDDRRTLAELQNSLKNYSIVSAAMPDSVGHDQRRFNAMTATNRRDQTIRFLAELEIMRHAEWFIGSETTNVASFVNFHRGGRGVIWI